MKVLAHHGDRVLELRLEPWRRVWEAALRGGEAVVAGDECLGEALGDPLVRFPGLPAQHHQMLGGKRAGLPEVLLLDTAEVREQPRDRTIDRTVGLRAR